MICPCDKCQFLFNQKRRPFSMNCKHNFCTKCLLKQNKAINMQNSQHILTTQPVNCPSCNKSSIPVQNQELYQKILSNNHYKEVDRVIKISFFGEANVGKTSLIYRLTRDIFENQVMPTIGGGFYSTKKIVQQSTIQYNLMDTAGQQKLRSFISSHFKQADIAMIVFDLTKSIKTNKLKQWVAEVEQKCITKTVLLVANKSDLAGDDLEKSESMAYAMQVELDKNWKCYCISCKDRVGIKELWKELDRIAVEQTLQRKSASVMLLSKGMQQKQQNKKNCC